MNIIPSNSTHYRNSLIALYKATFSDGASAQYIDSRELGGYIGRFCSNGGFLLAFDNNELAGALLYCPLRSDSLLPDEINQHFNVEKSLYIAELMVTGPARGKGLGTRLLIQFFETARNLEYSHVFIRVWEENIPALNLYLKMGFVKVGSIEQAKLRPGGNEAFMMKKIYLHKKIE